MCVYVGKHRQNRINLLKLTRIFLNKAENNMLKVAMIGAGGYAYELIKRMWTIPEKYELVAVSSNPSRKSAGKTACEHKGVEIYPDPDSLLAAMKGKVDVIFVPTPIHTHKDLGIKCIEAGFDVFLEKPPVATVQELDELDAYATAKGKRVAVMFQSFYTSIMHEMKEIIASGKLGNVKRVRGIAAWIRTDEYYTRGWAGKLKTNGDWVLDGTINNPLAHQLSNEMNLACMEPGKIAHPAEVTAELYHGHDIESEDTSSLRILTTDGVEIVFNATLCPEEAVDPIIVVECEEGTIEYSNFNEARITFADGAKQNILDETEQRTYMLERLHDSYLSGEEFDCSLVASRPFTVAVNAAFESCGKPHPITSDYILRSELGDTIKTVIKSIDDFLAIAHSSGKLFSEIGCQWAVNSKPFNTDGYKKFPTTKFVD
jgi:predicted dehydrogenase